MIHFSLRCDEGHDFAAWFASGADFEEQSKHGLVNCPQCGSAKVEKAPMAPAVAHRRKTPEGRPLAMNPEQAENIRKIREMVSAIRASSEDVGERFAEEARRIHYGESDPRGIVGRASRSEARELVEEGIAFAPLPTFPGDAN